MFEFGGYLYRFNNTAFAWLLTQPYLYLAITVLLFALFVREWRVRRGGGLGGGAGLFLRTVVAFPMVALTLCAIIAGAERFHADVLSEALKGKVAIILDSSASMRAEDIPPESKSVLEAMGARPNRLALCKEAIYSSLQDAGGLEIVLVSFTGYQEFREVTWRAVAGSTGRAWLRAELDSLAPARVGAGSNLLGIFTEMREMYREPEILPDLAIFCSDGGKFSGTMTSVDGSVLKEMRTFASRELKRERFDKTIIVRRKVIPIAVLGSGGIPSRPAPIPAYDGERRTNEFELDPATNTLLETMYHEDVLREIGERSGGAYVHLSSFGDGRRVFATLVRQSIATGDVTVESAESLRWPLAIVAFLAALIYANGFSWLGALRRH